MSALAPGCQLTLLRAAKWRFAVPMDCVNRILSAAMPVAMPVPGDGAQGVPSRLRLGPELLPVVYAAVFFGEEEATLRAEDKMVLLDTSRGRCVLWVDSVEDMFIYQPIADAPRFAGPASEWILTVTGGELSVPVLDVDRLITATQQL